MFQDRLSDVNEFTTHHSMAGGSKKVDETGTSRQANLVQQLRRL
jgi:hypothetical protein